MPEREDFEAFFSAGLAGMTWLPEECRARIEHAARFAWETAEGHAPAGEPVRAAEIVYDGGYVRCSGCGAFKPARDPGAVPCGCDGGREEERALFLRASRVWGVEAQLRVLLEEMAELQVAVLHAMRGRAPMERVRDEAVDVGICLGQVRAILADEPGYAEERARKIARLRERVETAEAAEARRPSL